MIRVIITSVITRNSYGVINGCRNEADEYLRVILPADLWPAEGEVYEVDGEEGEYCNDYGKKCRQITATDANRIRTSGRLIRPWLESIPGVGETRSERLMEEFGERILEHICDPEHLERLALALDPKGTILGMKLAGQVQAYYLAHQSKEGVDIAEADFLIELEKCGVDDRKAAKKMFRLIGSTKAFDLLIKTPYLSAGLMPWKQANHLGLRLLARGGVTSPKNHVDRLSGACDSVLRDQLKKGNTAIDRSTFIAALKKKKVPAQQALSIGIQNRRIIDSGDLLRAPGAAYLECTLADRLIALMNDGCGIDRPDDLDAFVQACENPKRPLTAEQRRAVCGILGSKFSILQGGAGTGKTTTMLAVVTAWEKLGGNVMLGALSGKAALRLSQATGKLAQTLARHLIRLEKTSDEFKNSYTTGLFPEITNKTLIIIDEASMVDLSTMHKLMGFIDSSAHVVLVGDVSQLPPVGLGQVYHDLVSADMGVFWLTKPLRQISEDGSDITNPIIDVADDIRNGESPNLPPFIDIDTGAFHLDNDGMDVESTVVGVLDYLRGKVSLDEILVLTSLRQTCTNINNAMATRRQNDNINGIRLSRQAPFVSIGDPIICTRNRYVEALMNGQIGHVNTLDPLSVRWDGDDMGKPVDPAAYFDLASAWAITCHRAQGSESRFVIVALDGEFMLTREWLYTAATRATQQVIFVGPQSLIESAIVKRSTRTTYFARELALRR